VAVGLLGALQLQVDDRFFGAKDFGGRKPKQVIEILLIHQGEPVAKDRIVDLLWAEKLPRDPMRTLEAYVSGLRGHLHPDPAVARSMLCSEPGAYRFALDAAALDLWRFDELAARAGAARPAEAVVLRDEALRLVRGELLSDEPYAEWTFALRDLYVERHLEMLVDSAHDNLLAGRPNEALDQAERALLVRPTRERAYRLLMAAHYALGDQDLALRTYDRCRTALVETLGVSPLPETERVYLAVLNQEPLSSVLWTRPPPSRPPSAVRPRPTTRYARSGDATIAFQTVGDGPLDVVFAPGWFSHVEVGWEEPRYADFLHRIAEGRRLLLFDKRGVGMSDPAPVSVSLDERADDITAVMDAAGSPRAVIFGVSEGGPMGVSLAVRSPERVAGLILYSSFGRLMRAPDYPWGWDPEFLEVYQAGIDAAWTAGHLLEAALPIVEGDDAARDWVSRYLRLSVSPATARTLVDFAATTDIREQLPLVSTPTLVLHRADEQWLNPGHGRYVAAHIPGARYVELPGADHWPWFGDADAVLQQVDSFLDGLAL
jgi:pimeloyl-ACP methyl ester carboxylesterase/DNA-binding SARP family transcriptional activator